METLSNKTLEMHQLVDILQQSLNSGWELLKNSEHYPVYQEAFEFFTDAGLYEGLFRPHIPNPVYDNAAKECGKVFLKKSLELGIYYSELFPGDFLLSTEETLYGEEFRYFYLNAYQNKQYLGKFKLSFKHYHDRFDFPVPPSIELVSEGTTL